MTLASTLSAVGGRIVTLHHSSVMHHALDLLLRRSVFGRSASACSEAVVGPNPKSEKDTTLAQKLSRLQPFIAVFSQEFMDQLESFGPT